MFEIVLGTPSGIFSNGPPKINYYERLEVGREFFWISIDI